MKRTSLSAFARWAACWVACPLFLVAQSDDANSQQTADSYFSEDDTVRRAGRSLFRQFCQSCHFVENSSFGPTLGGITGVREPEWLLKFVRDPIGLAASGNPTAQSLIERYKIPMPGFGFLTDSELKSIFTYIRSETRELDLSYRPEGNNPRFLELLKLPHEPIPTTELTIELEEVATLPSQTNDRAYLRLANLRHRPGEDGGPLYVNDHDGFIYRVDGSDVTLVFDVHEHYPAFVSRPGLATGLGSFAFHPEFLKTPRIYFTHTESPRSKSTDFSYDEDIPVLIQWVLTELTLPSLDAPFGQGVPRELMRINVPDKVHGMQEIAFRPNARPRDSDFGLLYIGLGDSGSTVSGYPDLCHNLDSPLGTILRIDPLGRNGRNGEYGIPADNPFVDRLNLDTWPEIYAWGFRNPHRFTWDHLNDNRMIATDIGFRAFEEINVIEPGKDYGWNVRDGHVVLDPRAHQEIAAIPWDVVETDFVKPHAVYSHLEGNAVIGGHVYRGSIAALQGKYIFGDIVSGRIFYIDVINEQAIPQPIFEIGVTMENWSTKKLREILANGRADLRFGEDANGELYLMTKLDGKIRRVVGAR